MREARVMPPSMTDAELRRDVERDVEAYELRYLRHRGVAAAFRRTFRWPRWVCWTRGFHRWSIDHTLNWSREFSIKWTRTVCTTCRTAVRSPVERPGPSSEWID
jgi:hypothetical protein